VVQERLGHAKAAMTLDFYAHAQEDKVRQATAIFSSLIFAPRRESRVVGLF